MISVLVHFLLFLKTIVNYYKLIIFEVLNTFSNSLEDTPAFVRASLICLSFSIHVTLQCALKYQPPLKNTTPSFLPSPPLNLQTVQALFFRQSPLYIGFSWTPLKDWIFQWTPKLLRFFIVNSILSFKSNKILS